MLPVTPSRAASKSADRRSAGTSVGICRAARCHISRGRPNFGRLEIELTIDDPKVYTKPFTVNLTEDFEADTELIDEFCLEGEKDYERLQRSRGK